jgi:hypothetical protein
MTKEGRRKQLRWRRSTLFVAMLATLAFAGGGQALAPAPAAALQIDACAQPESGLCNPVDENPAAGDNPTGTGQGSGSVGGLPGVTGTTPPPPTAAPWDKKDSNGVPAWMVDNHMRDLRARHLCGKISDRSAGFQKDMDEIVDIFIRLDNDGRLFDSPDPEIRKLRIEKRKLRAQLNYLDDQWDSYNCTGLGF